MMVVSQNADFAHMGRGRRLKTTPAAERAKWLAIPQGGSGPVVERSRPLVGSRGADVRAW